MIFITGPLYSGKRTFAHTLPGHNLKMRADVQLWLQDTADLPALADRLAHAYDILIATEVGGGVVPIDANERAAAKQRAALPVCWRRVPPAWCRCSAASPPF